ncbi:alpha-ketoglutarate-dependent dioxygenase AlkB family protein [Nonlabens ponticola]|uniref:Alpha-ketoglutarate-dependent dioxygenase AlkB n=1 Tax=Nonlabens ponticola TaxID=2496866 RepID=A0A3S9MX88_9FLAO|nr:alpha-ketoglutarate-dependent dioxygenase AlkB [Nonlabens ponticola]AZQ43673.1 alpha-ketoglutarate-dependent dioxygenase AlkB [Nonlabens ponticola]
MIDLKIPDASVQYDDAFYAFAKAEHLQATLQKETPWRQNKITVFGKTYDEPRLTQLYGDAGLTYGYSGIQFEPLPWTERLTQIKTDVEKACGTQFNICLINLYRSGQDSNGWHADNEKELGKNPSIASISFGAQRYFHLKHNDDKEKRFKLLLKNGSLLYMSGETQHTYKHQIAKTKREIQPRINLTFRKVVL